MTITPQNVEAYVAQVSILSGLDMNAERQEKHIAEFQRLANDVEKLNSLMGQKEHLTVGPVCFFKHDEDTRGMTSRA